RSAGAGEIAFIEDARLLARTGATAASCLIIPSGAAAEGICAIEVAQPKLAFALIAEQLHPVHRPPPGVDPSAHVAPSASVHPSIFVAAGVRIGERSSIGASSQIHFGAVIGEDVTIGRDCVIHPNAVLYRGVQIGDRVVLHAGAVIGADGFGYVRVADGYRKFPQVGSVRIDDDVEIGALTCIDRGALGDTRIGRGTKIDNLVQIAHNVQIGARVVIAAQTGISGSTVIEDDVVIGGQVGMGDHARVETGAMIGSKAGVLTGKVVRAGQWWGIPVQPLAQYKKLNAHLSRVPQMRDEIKELRAQIAALQEKIAGGG
ncbi:MAG TPA: UDP-3-O-(3-hydroxymyristoyl)glucosamine N-acyltransferase, partial [Chthoniobacterales bacterium]